MKGAGLLSERAGLQNEGCRIIKKESFSLKISVFDIQKIQVTFGIK